MMLSQKPENIMIKLSQALEGKNVRITDIKNIIWAGKVTDYVYPEDNDPEVESIIIKCEVGRFPGKSVEFTAEEILYIEEID